MQYQIDALREYYVVEGEDGERQLPEMTDAWVKETLEFENIDEFKTRVHDSILEQKEQELPSLREFRSSTEIAKRLVGDVPESIVQRTEQDNYKDLFQSLQAQRVTLDTYLEANQLTPESFRDSMHEQAHTSAAIALALDALARHLGLQASDDEVKEEFVKSGAKDPERLFKNWQSNGRLSEVRQGLIRIKAAKHLYDTAEIFEPGTLTIKEDKPKKKSSKKADTAKIDADDKNGEENTKKKPTTKAKSAKTAKLDSNKETETKAKSKDK
jgi:trigger factor